MTTGIFHKRFEGGCFLGALPLVIQWSDSGISLWMPNESEVRETGARRGTGYVFSSEALAAIPRKVLNELKLSEFRL